MDFKGIRLFGPSHGCIFYSMGALVQSAQVTPVIILTVLNIGLKHRTCAATPTNRHRSATCGLQVWAQCSLELYHGRYPEPVCTCCLVFRGPPPRILRSNLIQTESDCMEWYLIFALGTSGLCHKSGLAK